MAGLASAQPAQTVKDMEVNWNVRQATDSRLTMLDNTLMGDSVDPDTGGLNFSHTDVSLPGNFGLEVAIRRNLSQGWKYHETVAAEFGDWWLEVPKITQLMPLESTSTPFSCATQNEPDALSITVNGSSGGEPIEVQVPYKDYSDGLHVHVPGPRLEAHPPATDRQPMGGRDRYGDDRQLDLQMPRAVGQYTEL